MERMESIHYKEILQGNIDHKKMCRISRLKNMAEKNCAGLIVLIKARICLRAFRAAKWMTDIQGLVYLKVTCVLPSS